jgi:hypothetical protein
MEKAQKETSPRKGQNDDSLEALCELFGLVLILTLIWLMDKYF